VKPVHDQKLVTNLLTWLNQFREQVYLHGKAGIPVDLAGTTRYIAGFFTMLGYWFE